MINFMVDIRLINLNTIYIYILNIFHYLCKLGQYIKYLSYILYLCTLYHIEILRNIIFRKWYWKHEILILSLIRRCCEIYVKKEKRCSVVPFPLNQTLVKVIDLDKYDGTLYVCEVYERVPTSQNIPTQIIMFHFFNEEKLLWIVYAFRPWYHYYD